CKNTTLTIINSEISVSIGSSAIGRSGKIIMSASTYRGTRSGFELDLTGNFSCTFDITLLNCNIGSDELAAMSWYYENKKSLGRVSVDPNGKPVISVNNDGNYTIQ
ncbi:MAG: hypothetical protein J1E40_06405, partial [Oscillospiraceae bacterium]|nr:hypothetical protein [Oscillospiraceae bacterium]